MYRLVSGKFEEIAASTGNLLLEGAAEQQDEEAKKSEEDDRKDESQSEMLKNNLKSRKTFQMAINDKTVPPSIKRLSYVANVVLLSLIGMAIAEYVLTYDMFANIRTNFEMIEASYKRTAEIQKVAYNVRTMTFMKESLLTRYMKYGTAEAL